MTRAAPKPEERFWGDVRRMLMQGVALLDKHGDLVRTADRPAADRPILSDVTRRLAREARTAMKDVANAIAAEYGYRPIE
jgi:heme exporter protein D